MSYISASMTLKQVDAGSQVVDVARKHRVSPATIHRWKSKYSGMTLSELRRLRHWLKRNISKMLATLDFSVGFQ